MLKLFKSALVALLGLGMASVFASTYPVTARHSLANALDMAWGFEEYRSGGAGTYQYRTALGDIPGSFSPSEASHVGKDAAGNVVLHQKGATNVPGTSTKIPVESKIKLSGQVVGKTLAKATLAVTLWQAGSALYDIWADAGLQLSNGQVVDPSAPGAVVSTGYLFQYQHAGVWYRSHVGLDVCNQISAVIDSLYSRRNVQFGVFGPLWCQWERLNGGTWQARYQEISKTTSGACPAGQYVLSNGTCSTSNPSAPLTEQQIADRIAQQSGWPDSTITGAMADALKLPGVPAQIAPDVQALPSSNIETAIQGVPQGTPTQVGDPVVTTETTSNPDGTTTNKQTTTTRTATAVGNQIKFDTSSQTTTTVSDPQGNPISTTTTTTTTPQTPTTAAEGEDLECGLPDTPACRIDEAGTPETVPELENPQQQADDVYKPLADIVEDPESFWPELPEFNWSFQLPTGCGILNVPAFEPFLTGIDVCQFQPMFHDIMSVVWVMGGLLGAIGLFWRNTMATQ